MMIYITPAQFAIFQGLADPTDIEYLSNLAIVVTDTNQLVLSDNEVSLLAIISHYHGMNYIVEECILQLNYAYKVDSQITAAGFSQLIANLRTHDLIICEDNSITLNTYRSAILKVQAQNAEYAAPNNHASDLKEDVSATATTDSTATASAAAAAAPPTYAAADPDYGAFGHTPLVGYTAAATEDDITAALLQRPTYTPPAGGDVKSPVLPIPPAPAIASAAAEPAPDTAAASAAAEAPQKRPRKKAKLNGGGAAAEGAVNDSSSNHSGSSDEATGEPNSPKTQRRLKNRESAQLSRKRKKEHLAELEKAKKELSAENADLKTQNAALTLTNTQVAARMANLTGENAQLRQRIAELERASASAAGPSIPNGAATTATAASPKPPPIPVPTGLLAAINTYQPLLGFVPPSPIGTASAASSEAPKLETGKSPFSAL